MISVITTQLYWQMDFCSTMMPLVRVTGKESCVSNFVKQAIKNLGPNVSEKAVSTICKAESSIRYE